MGRRGNPLISRMSHDAQKHPYADQPLAYYDRNGGAQGGAPAAQQAPAQGQQYGGQQFGGPQYGGSAYGQPQQGYGQQHGAPNADQLNQMYNAPSATPQDTQRATMNDVIMKSLIMIGLLVAGGAIGWVIPGIGLIGGLAAFVLALVVIFKKSTSPGLIMAYGVAEGLLLGAISAMFEAQFNGIVLMAILATVVVFVGMLALYAKAGLRMSGRVAGALGIAMVGYLVFVVGNMIYGAFTHTSMRDVEIPIFGGIPLGIPLGLLAVVMGALCLLADFQEIDRGLKAGVPQKESWRLAFGLMLTLVWLYVEILRLFSYFMRND